MNPVTEGTDLGRDGRWSPGVSKLLRKASLALNPSPPASLQQLLPPPTLPRCHEATKGNLATWHHALWTFHLQATSSLTSDPDTGTSWAHQERDRDKPRVLRQTALQLKSGERSVPWPGASSLPDVASDTTSENQPLACSAASEEARHPTQ